MTDKKADADAAIAKLNELLDGDVTVFTKEEAAALKEVAEAWRSAKGFVFIIRYTGNTLKWCVGFGLAWVVFKAGILEVVLREKR